MENQPLSRFKLAVVLFGVFATSFSVLSFEIALTRVFSIMLDYHYTFLVVSLALFGLGLGGVLAYYFSKRVVFSKKVFSRVAILNLFFSLLMSLLTLLVISLPDLDAGFQAFIMFLPFLVAGTILALTYKVFVSHSSILYFADLAGAALGSLAVIFLINFTGATVAILLVSLVTLVSTVLFSLVTKHRLLMGVAVLAIVAIGVFTQYSSSSNLWNIQPASNQGKELSNFLSDPSLDAQIVDSRWSSFGQVQLITTPALPHEKIIFVDGGAGTSLFHFNGDFNSTDSAVPELRNSTQYFPYYFVDKESALVIGPGGGLDVLTALMGGVNHIYAIEVNPSIVEIVRDYSGYAGGIYSDYSNVHVNVDEGRSFLKRSNQLYDTIVLDLPVSKTSQGTFGYALSENYLFTTDSFNDYLNHLSDNGFLVIVAHNEKEIYKLVSTAFKTLESQGLDFQQIMQRITIIGSSDHTNHSALPVFILKKTPITDSQAAFINAKAAEMGFGTLYTPLQSGVSSDSRLAHLARGGITINELVSIAPFNMKAPTDNDPFFYNFNLGIPETLIPLLTGAIMLSIIVTILYVLVRQRDEYIFNHGSKMKIKAKFSGFKWYCFASLGFGFMLIEIALIQKFILFLGEPTLAIAASLFSLLLAGGLGSVFSRKWRSSKQYNAFKVSLVIAVLAVAYIFVLPIVFDAALSFSGPVRLLVSFMLIFPLGFLMGIPFPTILGYIKQESENDAALMWCINGAFSVLAGVLALVVAMLYGFNAVLLLGALTYAVIFLIGRRHERNNNVEKIRSISQRKPQFNRTWKNKG